MSNENVVNKTLDYEGWVLISKVLQYFCQSKHFKTSLIYQCKRFDWWL